MSSKKRTAAGLISGLLVVVGFYAGTFCAILAAIIFTVVNQPALKTEDITTFIPMAIGLGLIAIFCFIFAFKIILKLYKDKTMEGGE